VSRYPSRTFTVPSQFAPFPPKLSPPQLRHAASDAFVLVRLRGGRRSSDSASLRVESGCFRAKVSLLESYPLGSLTRMSTAHSRITTDPEHSHAHTPGLGLHSRQDAPRGRQLR